MKIFLFFDLTRLIKHQKELDRAIRNVSTGDFILQEVEQFEKESAICERSLRHFAAERRLR